MTQRLYTTVYDPDDLPTEVAHIASKSLGTVNAWSELEYKHLAHGTGALSGRISRHHSQAALLQQKRYVIVHSDIGPIGGAFLEEGQIDLSAVDGKGTEWMVWSGRGSIAVLERGRLLEQWYSTDPAASPERGQFTVPDVWEWGGPESVATIFYGGVLSRSVEEGQDEPGNPLSMVTMWGTDGADRRLNDASGAAWTGLVNHFRTNIGNDTLSLAREFDPFGVTCQMSYLFRLDAYNAANFGTDRSGAFGALTVRFEKGVNIAAAIPRKVRGVVDRTHLLVGGADSVYVTVVHPSYVSGPAHWGFLSVPDSNDPDDLEAMGLAHLAARDRQTDAWILPLHDHGDDPVNGIYEPAPDIADGHFWVGDIASYRTGDGEYDAVEEASAIASITWRLKTGDEANGDYAVIVEVGSTFHWEENESFSGGPPGSQHQILLCRHTPGDNLLLGLTSSSIKVSSEDVAADNLRQYACDGDLGTVWDGVDGVGVPDQYWAADLGSFKAAMAFRLRTETPAHPTNFASAVSVYGSNDAAAWTWLPSGQIVDDPVDNGWALVSGYSGATFPVDSGQVVFDPSSYRYWMFRATAGATGGTNDWDINEVELFEASRTIGSDTGASRCDHLHLIEGLLTEETSTARTLRPDGVGGVGWVEDAASAALPWFSVVDYGAVGDGTTDDTSAINDAIAAYNAAGGGVLYFPAGHYQTTGGLTSITAGGLILGDGHAHRDGTTQAASLIDCSSSTASLFTIASHAVTMRGLTLVQDGSTPSAGAGITVTSGGHARYENLSVSSFFVGIDIQDGEHWGMIGCYIYNTVSHGLKLAHTDLVDGGDWAIVNSWFTAAARTDSGANAIHYISGGGGKITNCKINADGSTRYTNGISLAIPNGVQTGDLLIGNNSIENVSAHAIVAVTTGSGYFQNIVITGNQTAFYAGTNNSGKGVNLVGVGTADFENIVISGNLFHAQGTTRSAIQLTNCNNVTLVGNELVESFTSLYTSTTSTNITDYSDHGSFSGLGDDDHPQYIKDAEFAAKGDLLAGTGSGTFDNLGVGTDGQLLTADATQATGLKWADATGSETTWIVDAGAPSYSGSGPVTVALTSVFGIDSSGNPYYNAANVTDGEEAALLWDSDTGTYLLRPYYP